MIRTRVVLAISTLVLVLTALPAFAGARLTAGATAQPGATGHPVTITLDPGPAATREIQVNLPEGFVVEGCQPPEGWNCSIGERTATYQTLLGELGPFGLTLTVPSEPGGYPITIVQRYYSTDEASTWTPTLTVVAPEPDPEPTEDTSGDGNTADGNSADGGNSGATQDITEPDPGPSPSRSRAPSTTGGDDGTGEQDDASSSSTSPRRTQGRSSGSSFEITPRRTAPSQAPAAGAAVDEPAVAAPSLAAGEDQDQDQEDGDGTAVAAGGGSGTTGSPSLPSLPWQQWVGALLLLTGAAVLVVRQWGQHLAGAGATVADRLRGVGSATLRRIPGPWGG